MVTGEIMSNQKTLKTVVQNKINQLTSQKYCIEKKVSSWDLPSPKVITSREEIYLLDRVEEDIKYNQEILECLQ